MANLLGEPFDDYVNDQIDARQKLHGKPTREPDELRYLNGRNAWIKLASGVELNQNRLKLLKGNPLVSQEGEGDTLAKQNVLFNGLSDNNGNQRSGISGPNRAYGVGGVEQFGYSPMPGIIDMDFKCLNRGSIKKATLNIKAHNRNQFDVIDVLYMRLGYSVLLEWGYDKYLTNADLKSGKSKVENTQETLINNWFWKQRKSSYQKIHPKIQEYREKYDGNYDAAFGIISNFSWDFAQDGTYNIKIEIISMGDVIESLKVNLPSLYSLKSNSKGTGASLGKEYASLLQENGADAVGEKAFYDKLYPGLKEAITGWWDRAISGTGTKVGPPPLVYVGSDQKQNWTGIKDGAQTYYTKWNCKLTEIEFYGKGGTTPYANPLAKELGEEGFAFDDVKKQAVIDGIFQLFNNGNYLDKEEKKDKNQNTPFASNFVKETTKFAREFITENKSGVQTGAFAGWNDVAAANDQGLIYHFLPVGDTIIEPTVTLEFNDGWGAQDIDAGDIITSKENKKGYTNLLDEDNPIVKKFKKGNGEPSSLNNPYKTTVRGTWNTAFKDTPDNKKWNVILNSKDTKGNNLSEYLGITKEVLLSSVYNIFVEKKLADAYPQNLEQQGELDAYKTAAEQGALSKSQERNKYMLEQQMDRLQKDYITKDRNRIYEYFYGQREKLKDVSKGSVTLSKSTGKLGTVKEPKEILQLDIEPLDNQWYIRLGHFLNVLLTDIIPQISVDDGEDPPLVNININPETNICYTIDNVLSLNMKKILIRNDYFIKGNSQDDKPVVDPIMGNAGIEPFVVNEGGLMYGKIMNIYFNINRLEEIFDSTVSNKTVSLFKALKTISDDINESLGNINNIEPIIKEENDIYFIDQSTIPNLQKIAKKLNIPAFLPEKVNRETLFEIYGINLKKSTQESNFVRNIGLTTAINKKFATMITIGATSNGTIPGVEATAFSRWNLGIEDKFKSKLLDPKTKDDANVSPLSGSAGKQLQSKYATLLAGGDSPWQKFGLSDSGGSDGLKTVNDDNIKYTENIVSDFYTLMQAEESYVENSKAEKNPIESSVGFLPFNLKMEIDGIGGIKIFNRIRVQQSFLPSNYPETLEFIVTQVNHKLSNDDWVTSLQTIATSRSVLSKK